MVGFIVANTILLTVGFIFSKTYTQREGSSARAVSFFMLAEGLVGTLVMTAVTRASISLAPITIHCALAIAVLVSCNNLLNLKAYSLGNMAGFSTALMLGGMALPTLYGYLFLHETVYATKLTGIVIMVLSLMLMFLQKKTSKKYALFCLLAFFTNGLCSIVGKVYASYQGDTNQYLFWRYLFEILLSAVLLGVVFLQERNIQFAKPLHYSLAGIYALAGLLAGYIQMVLLQKMDAAFFYPIQTGLVVAFSFMVGRVIFHEKADKFQMLQMIGMVSALILMLV